MENLFLANANVDLKELTQTKQFLESIGEQIREAFANVRWFEYKPLANSTTLVVGCHENKMCCHDFKATGGVIEFTSGDILLFESRDKDRAIARRLLAEYPLSTWRGGNFRLKLEIKKSDPQLIQKIKAIIEVMTFGGFVYKR